MWSSKNYNIVWFFSYSIIYVISVSRWFIFLLRFKNSTVETEVCFMRHEKLIPSFSFTYKILVSDYLVTWYWDYYIPQPKKKFWFIEQKLAFLNPVFKFPLSSQIQQKKIQRWIHEYDHYFLVLSWYDFTALCPISYYCYTDINRYSIR